MNNSFGWLRAGLKVGSEEVELGEREDEGDVGDDDGVDIWFRRSHQDQETEYIVDLVRTLHGDAGLKLNSLLFTSLKYYIYLSFTLSIYLSVYVGMTTRRRFFIKCIMILSSFINFFDINVLSRPNHWWN